MLKNQEYFVFIMKSGKQWVPLPSLDVMWYKYSLMKVRPIATSILTLVALVVFFLLFALDPGTAHACGDSSYGGYDTCGGYGDYGNSGYGYTDPGYGSCGGYGGCGGADYYGGGSGSYGGGYDNCGCGSSGGGYNYVQYPYNYYTYNQQPPPTYGGGNGANNGGYNYVQYPYQSYTYNQQPAPAPTNPNNGNGQFNYTPYPYAIYNYAPNPVSQAPTAPGNGQFNFTPYPYALYNYFNNGNSGQGVNQGATAQPSYNSYGGANGGYNTGGGFSRTSGY